MLVASPPRRPISVDCIKAERFEQAIVSLYEKDVLLDVVQRHDTPHFLFLVMEGIFKELAGADSYTVEYGLGASDELGRLFAGPRPAAYHWRLSEAARVHADH